MGDADLLAVSLSERERTSQNLDQYLANKKGLSDALSVCLVAADHVSRTPRPVPSESFRRRAHENFIGYIQEQAANRVAFSRPLWLQNVRQLLTSAILGPAAAVMLAMSGAAVGFASESALPGSPLYPIKIGIERVDRLSAVTPTEQARARLRIAASRLTEAEAALRSGNSAVASVLLGQVDAEMAAAQAIATTHDMDNARPGSINRQIADLATTRDFILASVGPEPAVVDSALQPETKPSDPRMLAEVTTSPAPSRVPSASASTDSPRDSAATGPTTVSGADGSISNAVPIDRSVQLTRRLVEQIEADDGPSAMTTARAFVRAIGVLSVSQFGVADVLREERTSLVACQPMATASTRGALQLALGSLDRVLGPLGLEPLPSTALGLPAKTSASSPEVADSPSRFIKDGHRSRATWRVQVAAAPGGVMASIPLSATIGLGVLGASPPPLPPSNVGATLAKSSDHREASPATKAEERKAPALNFKAKVGSTRWTMRALAQHNPSVHPKPSAEPRPAPVIARHPAGGTASGGSPTPPSPGLVRGP